MRRHNLDAEFAAPGILIRDLPIQAKAGKCVRLEGGVRLSFFVAVYQDVRSEFLERTLATMRGDFATSYRLHPGRRNSRVFQSLEHPTSLIAVAEWDSERDYNRLRQSPEYQRATEQADPPARIEPLTRLRSFARMSRQPAYVACLRLVGRPDQALALEAVILGEVRRDVEASDGLISHDVYRVAKQSGQMVIVHGWTSLDALEQFRLLTRPRHRELIEGLGVVPHRFTGTIAVQYTRQLAPSGAVGQG
jgi:heme-degrading monooxygenase HmoA